MRRKSKPYWRNGAWMPRPTNTRPPCNGWACRCWKAKSWWATPCFANATWRSKWWRPAATTSSWSKTSRPACKPTWRPVLFSLRRSPHCGGFFPPTVHWHAAGHPSMPDCRQGLHAVLLSAGGGLAPGKCQLPDSAGRLTRSRTSSKPIALSYADPPISPPSPITPIGPAAQQLGAVGYQKSTFSLSFPPPDCGQPIHCAGPGDSFPARTDDRSGRCG